MVSNPAHNQMATSCRQSAITADFKGANAMVNILRLRDPEQWPEEKWDIGSVIAKRRALFYTETVWSPEIWKYNKWLLTQREEKLTIDELIEIWSHAIFCVYLTYADPDCDPELRHRMLLNLKEDFNKARTNTGKVLADVVDLVREVCS
jgi:hypothetical protein